MATANGEAQMSEIIARVERGRIRVKSPYEARTIAGMIPGGLWDKGAKEWHYPSSPTTAHAIFEKYTEGGFEIKCDREFVEIGARAADQIDARAFKTMTELPEPPGKIGPAWLHQKQAHAFQSRLDGSLAGVGMGGGKTKIAIGLLEEWRASHVLICCPKSVVDVWPKEFAKHSEADWKITFGAVISTRTGRPKKTTSVKDRAEQIATDIELFDANPADGIAVVVNYEAMWQGALGELLLSREWDAVILDESHRIKAPGGAASKYVARLRDKAKRRVCLTGTPQPHSPLDIYAQARFIDPGVFGTNFARFRNRYAIMKEIRAAGGRFVKVIDKDAGDNGYQRLDELADKIASFSFIIEQDELDEYLGLPEAIDLDRHCTLSPKSQKVYDEVWNELAVTLDEGTVTASNVLTRLLRVQQITSGHLPTDDEGEGSTVVEVGREKATLLADILEDIPNDEPIVIFARFTHDLDVIRKIVEDKERSRDGRRYGELSGRSKDGMTAEATMRDDIDVLGVQLQAGGVGIDLTRASHAIYFSMGFNLGDYLQSRKRVHRPGQKRMTRYMHLIAKGTVDELVYAALAERKEVVDYVTKEVKAR